MKDIRHPPEAAPPLGGQRPGEKREGKLKLQSILYLPDGLL